MSERRSRHCLENLPFESDDFDIAQKYFSEAKGCYINGHYNGSIVLAVSALESAIKTDFVNFCPDVHGDLGDKDERLKKVVDTGKEWSKISYLLKQYFAKTRFDRLPRTEDAIKDRIYEIRNSVVHTKDDVILDLSTTELERYARRMLDDVKILLDHLDKRVRSIGRCPKCCSELEVVKAINARYGNRYIKCTNNCDYKGIGLKPNEKPFLNNRRKVCQCGRPLVQGQTLKRNSEKGNAYRRCLENCLLTPVKCKKCGSGMKVLPGELGIFFKCMNEDCKRTWS